MQPTDLSQHTSDTQEDTLLCLTQAKHKPKTIHNQEAPLLPLLFPDGKQTFQDEMIFSEYINSSFFQ